MKIQKSKSVKWLEECQMIIFWSCILAIPNVTISSDGLKLTFDGDGIVDQNLARSKGSYKRVEEVNINGSVILDESAFEMFSSMKIINLSDFTLEIKRLCFSNCASLLDFTFPNSITHINSEIFSGCTSLTTVRIGSSIQSINSYLLFRYCNKLSYFEVSLDNPILSTDSSHQFLLNKNGSILISASANQKQIYPKSITTINEYCYYSLTLTSIDFSQSNLQRVMKQSFSQVSINSLTFPRTLQRIDDKAFYQSTINTLSLPSSLTFFDKNALLEIRGLVSLNVEDSKALIKRNGLVTDINQTILFFVDPNISTIILSENISFVEVSIVRKQSIMEVEANNSYYSSFDGALYNPDKTIFRACPGGKLSVTLYQGCKTINSAAFQSCSIERITLNEGLETIKDQAFSSCSNLVSINIPTSLISFYNYCFAGTTALTIDIKLFDKVSTLDKCMFSDSSITSIDLSECVLVSSLPKQMFNNCKLRSIRLPPNLLCIEELSFASSSIESIEFPSALNVLQKSCFEKCKALREIDLKNTNISDIPDSCFESSGITMIELPSKLESISTRSFALCLSLRSIIFQPGSNLKIISPAIIWGCEVLETFKVPNSVISISDGAFSHSYGLINFTTSRAPKEVRSNGEIRYEAIDGILYSSNRETLFAFPGGRSIANVQKEVKNIQILAFEGSKKLEIVNFDEESRIQSLEDNTFLDCIKLRDVVLPNKLQLFKSTTFSGCKNIETVRFTGNSNLKIIPRDSFKGCPKLTYFEFHPNIETIEESAFEGCHIEYITLYNVTTILDRAFCDCSNLKAIRIISTLKTLSNTSFDGCQRLKEFLYCGKGPHDEVTFNNCPLEVVFVGRNYNGDRFGIKPIHRILDGDCLIATDLFSVGNENCLDEIFLLGNFMTSDE